MPHLDLRGTSTIRDYHVNVLITGPLTNPEAIFSSDPPLPQSEIVSLIATGSTTRELSGDPNVLAGRAAILLLQKIYRSVFRRNKPPACERFVSQPGSVRSWRDRSKNGQTDRDSECSAVGSTCPCRRAGRWRQFSRANQVPPAIQMKRLCLIPALAMAVFQAFAQTAAPPAVGAAGLLRVARRRMRRHLADRESFRSNSRAPLPSKAGNCAKGLPARFNPSRSSGSTKRMFTTPCSSWSRFTEDMAILRRR